MNIGILTFSRANNIGALLQAYALQEYLVQNNASAEHIDFRYKTKKNSSTACVEKHPPILSKIAQFKGRYYNRIKRQKFEGFRSRYIRFNSVSYTDSIQLDTNYDAVIAGSDQIWNTDLNGDNTAFYLDFVGGAKYTYSASVGRELTERDKQRIREFAPSFSRISAREADLQEYIEDATGLECALTVDPVFLLEKNEWERVEEKICCPKKYVFAYVMEDTDRLRSALKTVSQKYNAKIVWVQGGGASIKGFPGRKIDVASPQEFLYLINHSIAVVTNSFHGAAFSSIFEKPLCIVSHTSRNARLVQLVHNIAREDKVIYSSDIDNIEKHMITSSENHIHDLVSSSKRYLLDIIEQRG